MEREAVFWNCSCEDALKGTVLHRTVQRDRVNGKFIRTYAEQFHTEPFQSPCKRSLRLAKVGDILEIKLWKWSFITVHESESLDP